MDDNDDDDENVPKMLEKIDSILFWFLRYHRYDETTQQNVEGGPHITGPYHHAICRSYIDNGYFTDFPVEAAPCKSAKSPPPAVEYFKLLSKLWREEKDMFVVDERVAALEDDDAKNPSTRLSHTFPSTPFPPCTSSRSILSIHFLSSLIQSPSTPPPPLPAMRSSRSASARLSTDGQPPTPQGVAKVQDLAPTPDAATVATALTSSPPPPARHNPEEEREKGTLEVSKSATCSTWSITTIISIAYTSSSY
jgi:hypothetical protein